MLVPQNQVLILPSAHFAIEGEYRSIDLADGTIGLPITLVPQHTDEENGAIVLGIHEDVPGGDNRGASAVDFQNSRTEDSQVASGRKLIHRRRQETTRPR